MRILTKLLTFYSLISICLAVTIPKPILIRLCETARLARSLNLNNDVVIASMNGILSDTFLKNGLSSRMNQVCETVTTIDNNGVIQVGVLFELLALMGNSRPVRHDISTLESPPNYPAISSMLSALNSSVQHNLTDFFLSEFYDIFKLPQSNDTIDLNSFFSDLVSNATSKIVSSSFPYCENIDFPESVDIENQIEVQKAVLKIISSVLTP